MAPPQHAEDGAPLLALETATGRGSVAIALGEAIHERVLPADRATAESLLPAIDALLAETGVGLADLGGFAVSIGPGSFTGLRIGVASVKGLAFGSELPVAAVPTLEALACRADPGEGPVVALLDARRDELYAAGFPVGSDALPEGLYAGAELAARLPARCRLVGDADGLACRPLREGLGPGVSVPDAGRQALASDVARLGRARLRAGEGVPAAALVPRYVRRAQAEALRTGLATEA